MVAYLSWGKRGGRHVMATVSQRGNGVELLYQYPIFAQNVCFCDQFSNTGWLAHIGSAQNEDLIGVKDGVAVFVEDDEFVAVFLPDFLAELADSRFLSLLCELILSIHPSLEGDGESHHHNREGDDW